MYFLIVCIIVTPLLTAVAAGFAHRQKAAGVIIRCAVAAIIGFSVALVWYAFPKVQILNFSSYSWPGIVMLVIECVMCLYIIRIGIRNKSWLVSLFSAIQIGLLIWLELGYVHEIPAHNTLVLDKLTLLMILIIAIVGGLVCIYTIEYIKDYHRHHAEIPDRRYFFYAVMFVFIATMFGLVMSNDLIYMLFFWEITSFCSYLLIGYTGTEKARKNSMLALTINVGGGLAFLTGILILAFQYKVTDLESLLALGSDAPLVEVAVFLIALAGLTKAAQVPFSRWLLGAMVAPTPSSAMLHSSTMVKAGVYLIIRLAPLLGVNVAGTTVTLIGGLTFLVAALKAITQNDAKKILAYSTISNLGLIVTCAGIGTGESLWAAIMLIVFHAIAKSLLFLTVGSTEYQIGSRKVDDMDGLYRVSLNLAILLIIGIAGMFLAPFGMLVSKWAAMKAFLDSGNVLIVLILAFGSSVTLFFWTKWMGGLIANTSRTHTEPYIMRLDEKVSLYSLAGLVIVVCILHPVISNGLIVPYIDQNLHISLEAPIDPFVMTMIIMMLGMLFIMPVFLIPLYRKNTVKRSMVYMAGENAGDNESFHGSMGQTRTVELRNWYMRKQFGGKAMEVYSIIIGASILVIGFVIITFGLMY